MKILKNIIIGFIVVCLVVFIGVSYFLLTGKLDLSSFLNESYSEQPASNLESASIERVVDGDTLQVKKADGNIIKVRLIGVNTPESVHPDESKNTEAGKTASDYTKSLLTKGQQVWLEYDVQLVDTYGRTLAYVWLNQPTGNVDKSVVASSMLNGKLVADGYADVATCPPNVKYEKDFTQIQNERKK